MDQLQTSRQETRLWYDRISCWYDLFSQPWEGPARRAGLQMLAIQPGEKVLEIGPGTGHGLVTLAQAAGLSGRVYGLDLSPRMLGIAQKRLSVQNPSDNVLLLVADAACLPFPGQSFDALFASFVIELFEPDEISFLLNGCYELLHTGGRLCAVSMTRTGHSLVVRRLYEWGQRRFPRLIDCRPIYLSKALESAGFEIQASARRSSLDLPVEIVMAAKHERHK
jgi:ubiquinone/menaquinone biosynthesis C-methylase UbiE